MRERARERVSLVWCLCCCTGPLPARFSLLVSPLPRRVVLPLCCCNLARSLLPRLPPRPMRARSALLLPAAALPSLLLLCLGLPSLPLCAFGSPSSPVFLFLLCPPLRLLSCPPAHLFCGISRPRTPRPRPGPPRRGRSRPILRIADDALPLCVSVQLGMLT